jgi:transcriptional regulator with XRE-family HTH domain
MTRRQCRAARGLLNWSQERLAEAAGISQATVAGFESGQSNTMRNNILVMRLALEDGGVEFIDKNGGGPGVRLKVDLPDG